MRHGTAFAARFHPFERSGVTLPTKMLSNGVTGFLDALNSPNYAGGVTLNRSYDVLLMGWIATGRIEVDPNSPILFQLSNLESGARYIATGAVAHAPRRRGRSSEVAARVPPHLRGVLALQRLPRLPEHCGCRAWLVQARCHRASGGRSRRCMLSLHSSITVSVTR